MRCETLSSRMGGVRALIGEEENKPMGLGMYALPSSVTCGHLTTGAKTTTRHEVSEGSTPLHLFNSYPSTL
jgi:hypothetical protein